MFMILMLSVTTFFQPMVALGETLDSSNDGDVQEIQLDEADAFIEVDEAVQQEVEKESKAVSDEKDVKQAVDEPVKNKGDPLVKSRMIAPAVAPSGAKSILTHPKTEVPNNSSEASSKYAFIAKFTPKTKLILKGATSKKNFRGHDTIVEPKNSLKGNLTATYTNVGLYKGRSLDLTLKVVDWKKSGFTSGDYLIFYDNKIAFSSGGFDHVTVEMTYTYSDNGKPATSLTGTYMTISDLDLVQSVGIPP